MKSYNNLFEKLIEDENIKKAINRSSLGKRERKDVAHVLADQDYHVKVIKDILIKQKFKVPNHELKEINDGITLKKRLIVRPRYKYEQIIHHSVIQILAPIIKRGMHKYSCGSIPGRGAHYGKRYIEKFIRNNQNACKYCLKMDVHHFFQSISHSELKKLLKKKIHDEKFLWIVFTLIDGYSDHEENGEVYGIPIGYYTSQWFANWFLEGLDHYIKENLKAKCYVRYMDDMIIFGSNKRSLHKTRKGIAEYLENIKLELKDNWQVFKFDYIKSDGTRCGRPLDFMGFKFYRDRTIVRKSIMLKATRKANRIRKKEHVTWYDACQMVSYLGWLKSADTYNVFVERIKPYVNVKGLRIKISKHGKELNNVRKLQESRGVSDGAAESVRSDECSRKGISEKKL